MKSTLKRVHRTNALVWVTFSLLFCISILAHASDSETFTSFDFPGAIDTEGTGITPSGVIVGRYTSADGKAHGFLMGGGSSFASIDFPGAISTDTTWINSRDEIVGSYDGPDGTHGYLLSKRQFTQIDYPGALATRAFGIGPLFFSTLDTTYDINADRGGNAKAGHGSPLPVLEARG